MISLGGSFGARLAAYRASAGLSQQELAERSGLSVRTVGALERGSTRWPHPDSVRRLADALGLGADGQADLVAMAKRRLVANGLRSQIVPAGGAANGVGWIPRQLPAALADFAGRRDELAVVDRLADQPGAVIAISGMAGVGKTTLALRWAHQSAARFPGGQLHADLRGFGPGMPADPAAVIHGFLTALGVHAGQIPADLTEAAALYRSVLAGRQILVVLDNAHDEQQVRPLLPGWPESSALVTSRRQLPGLITREGAAPLPLGVLFPAEARDLLTSRLGSTRAAAEPEAVTELIILCGRLPLALAIAAARAAARPGIPLAVLAAELRKGAERLDALDAGDGASSVRYAFSWSAWHLSEPAARMFRLLGTHPGPDISAAAAVSLAGTGRAPTHQALAELARANLIAEHKPGRYILHDLLRDYAVEQSLAPGHEDERRAATVRILDHYLHTAAAAALLLEPSRDQRTLGAPADGAAPEPLDDYGQALAWFDAENEVLLQAMGMASRAGVDTFVCDLPPMLLQFLHRRGRWLEMKATYRAAVAVADRLGDQERQARAHLHLGYSHYFFLEYQDADVHLRQALSLSRELGDHVSQGQCHYALARPLEMQERWDDALGHVECALAEFVTAGRRDSQAQCLNMIGWIHAHVGRYQQAVDYGQRALALFREFGETNGEACTLDSLGYVHRQLGQYGQAITCYHDAVTLFRQVCNSYLLACALVSLGDVQQAHGDPVAAETAWREGLAILDELHHPDAARVKPKLSSPARRGQARLPPRTAASRLTKRDLRAEQTPRSVLDENHYSERPAGGLPPD